MAQKDSIEHVDVLEDEIFSHEAFLHKKKLLSSYEKWLNSPEHAEDIKEYEKIISNEAENIDIDEMKVEEE